MQFRIDAFPCFRAKKLQWVGNDSLAFQREFRRPATGLANILAAAFVLHIWDRAILLTFQRRNQLLGL